MTEQEYTNYADMRRKEMLRTEGFEAFKRIRQQAAEAIRNGMPEMTMEEINEEIMEYRKEISK
jgi:hypothetical protein